MTVIVPALTLCLYACATPPRHVSSSAQTSLNPRTVERFVPLNINVAPPSALEKLPGIGKVIADRIVTYRTEYGPFRRPEHLMMVRGVSDKKFRAIRAMIAVE